MLVIPAHAKVNLALEVVRRRRDGWHDIESVVVPVDWHDLIGVDFAYRAGLLRVSGPASPGVPGARDHAEAGVAGDNLAARAADALVTAAMRQRTDGVDTCGLDVWVHKRVPAGAGLGGGSADAAATLLAGSRLLRQHTFGIDAAAISALAAKLGSDVPALFACTPVHVAGRGEHVAGIEAPVLRLVIVFLGPSSTRDTYGALQTDEMSDGSRVRDLVARLGDLVARMDGSHQDVGDAAGAEGGIWDDLLGSALEGPALRINPSLSAAARHMRASTSPLRWHMTGSGGAFFAVMPDAVAADELAGRLRTEGFLARACRTLPASLRRR